MQALQALTPLDGRYRGDTAPLRAYFSELALIRARVRLEIAYLIALSQETPLVRPLTPAERRFLEEMARGFTPEEAAQVKQIEQRLRHDVKAVEHYLRARLAKTSLADVVSWLHFGLTSDDVNLTAQAQALRQSRDEVLLPALDEILALLGDLAWRHKATPMLARTHGQPAVPTTFGKEMAVFWARLEEQRRQLAAHRFVAKWSGAVGNYNAILAAAPQVDWPDFSARFLRRLGLEAARISTQIIPYENWLAYFQMVQRINGVLLDLCRDMWGYISNELVRLRVVREEVGSSTMPQKVNPIDFENAEGNLGLANALFEHYARKLPLSRWQRDLSDSTVRRSFGEALGHTLVAWRSVARGLRRIEPHTEHMRAELQAHWEVIAEGAQTILRAANIPTAYEQLKALVRGQALTPRDYQAWVEALDVAPSVKARLRALSPLRYLGLAQELVERLVSHPRGSERTSAEENP